uniref:hypothetical protein n=1 Tax=Brucella pseudintermedia TaxID=370111 RepID=UPI001AEEA07F
DDAGSTLTWQERAEKAEADNAAKDAEIAKLIHDLNRIKDHETELVNDNAAQAARIKELEQINAVLMGDDEDKPRYTTKRLKQEIARATEALEAKLAAKEARIKELEADAKHIYDSFALAQDRAKALEAKIAAAQEAHKSLFGDKTMEDILWPDVKPTDLITIRVQKQIYDKARAVLGGKPS